jgi:hypothetical protein
MAFNVYEFRSQMQGDGARPNLFEVQLTFPTAVNPGAANKKLTFMCKTASLPGSTIGHVPVFYFGRETKLAGNRTFPEWTLSILNDEDFAVRNAFEKWMNGINRHVSNVRDLWAGNSLGYSTQGLVKQYGKTGDILKQYTFEGIFPVDISQIDLDWGSNDTIEEYSVTLAYQYFTSVAKDNTVIV